jgi:hypothetical protein
MKWQVTGNTYNEGKQSSYHHPLEYFRRYFKIFCIYIQSRFRKFTNRVRYNQKGALSLLPTLINSSLLVLIQFDKKQLKLKCFNFCNSFDWQFRYTKRFTIIRKRKHFKTMNNFSNCPTSSAPSVSLWYFPGYAKLVTLEDHLLVPGTLHFVLPNCMISFHYGSEGIP